RLIHYQFVTRLMAIVGVLDRMAGEIRNLQRTEIGELIEPFETKFVGSSAMPQKMNPERSERICGISRYLRQLLSVAHGNISLEHERDLTNSSSERLLIPQLITLTDFILKEMVLILKQIKLDEDRIKHNLLLLNGRQCSENLLKHLVQPLGRQNAHKILRELTKEPNFMEAVKNHSQIRETLSEKEIDDILNPYHYVGLVPEVVDRVVSKIQNVSKSD
ncbi:MAG: adenylosuccinate lyase, partial [Candidatus Heimdallarchaeota archaeon]